MRLHGSLLLAAVLGLAGCGSSSPAPAAPMLNAFTGTITVTSAIPAGNTSCIATSNVIFGNTAVDVHTVNVAGGGCIAFINSSASAHQVQNNTSACAELTSGPIAAGSTFVTVPFSGPKTCYWEDADNPPTGGGGGGY